MLPFLLLIGLYFYFDPFMLRGIREEELTRYGNVELNSDYLSSYRYLKGKDSYQWNSFMFGSSRVQPFHPDFWQPYLDSTDNIFVFKHRGGENIQGIYEKLKLIDAQGGKLKNVLIAVSIYELGLREPDYNAFMAIHSPILTEDNTWFSFGWKSFKTFFSKGLFVRYFDYKLFGQKRDYMKLYLKNYESENPATNTQDLVPHAADLDSVAYYKGRGSHFFLRDTTTNSHVEFPTIDAEQAQYLKNIKQIFDKHQTHFHFVIVPVYEPLRVNKADLTKLQHILGAEKVSDFSGITPFSRTKYSFSDVHHLRFWAAKGILQAAYSQDKQP